jgi:hypothetical protein
MWIYNNETNKEGDKHYLEAKMQINSIWMNVTITDIFIYKLYILLT